MELLVPCGKINDLPILIQEQIDAVYIGYSKFQLRASYDDLTIEDIDKLIFARSVTKESGTKLYIVINSLINNCNFDIYTKHLNDVAKINPDALILGDIGGIVFFRKNFPNIPVHISSLQNLFTKQDLLFCSKIGVKRIILPSIFSTRLSGKVLSLIKGLVSENQLEIECFLPKSFDKSFRYQCRSCSWNFEFNGLKAYEGKCTFFTNGEGYRYCELARLQFSNSLVNRDYNEMVQCMYNLGVRHFKLEGRQKPIETIINEINSFNKVKHNIKQGKI